MYYHQQWCTFTTNDEEIADHCCHGNAIGGFMHHFDMLDF